jgi:hypothetical protein
MNCRRLVLIERSHRPVSREGKPKQRLEKRVALSVEQAGIRQEVNCGRGSRQSD